MKAHTQARPFAPVQLQGSEKVTVPHFHPEVADFRAMPAVFATGFRDGLLEWTCMQLLAPHLDPGEWSVGLQIDVGRTAATPPSMTVAEDIGCIAVIGPRVTLEVSAHGGLDLAGKGRHQRFVVAWNKFNARLDQKVNSLAAEN
jgi:fluoroacetyl-CoA thioesterase